MKATKNERETMAKNSIYFSIIRLYVHGYISEKEKDRMKRKLEKEIRDGYWETRKPVGE